jgi:hypothetical protein
MTIASTNLSNPKSPALVVILHAVKKATIQQGRKGTYSQTEYGSNALVVGDGGDREINSRPKQHKHGATADAEYPLDVRPS